MVWRWWLVRHFFYYSRILVVSYFHKIGKKCTLFTWTDCLGFWGIRRKGRFPWGNEKMKESQLFAPLKTYLEGQGYAIYSEVKHCDLVARKGGEMLIVESKLRLSFQLLLQAVHRQEACDSVYMAVALTRPRSYPANFPAVKRLLRRLGIGIIFVRFLKTKTRVEIALHPTIPRAFKSHVRQQSIIREIDGRYAEFNKSGETVSSEKITAYKQQALYIAYTLSSMTVASPATLRKLGLPAKTGAILARNIYGWFLHPARGQYSLSREGRRALTVYRKIVAKIIKVRHNQQ